MSLNTTISLKNKIKLPNIIFIAVYILFIISISGCSTDTKKWPETHAVSKPLVGEARQSKSIFVFLDGTGNDPKTPTNIWRLFNMISSQKDPLSTGIYIPGVGTTKYQFLGMLLGLGMEDNILEGYSFIIENYKPGDKIYIFGFSRGALEARSLAGLIAYSGVPKVSGDDLKHLHKIGNKVLELTKDKNDSDYEKAWGDWTPNSSPLLTKEIKDRKLETQAAEVTFLGIWDTVPGSFFKEYGTCKENENKKAGDRYKTGTYPAIREIAHAVSIDEKRSKFKPILVCKPVINSQPTQVNEVWFPGAHADVGGGYENSKELPGDNAQDLPNISLHWMLGLLGKHYDVKSVVQPAAGKADGLAHWSIGDFSANLGSDCIDRERQFDAETIKNIKKDGSFEGRKTFQKVPIEKEGSVETLAYPIACP